MKKKEWNYTLHIIFDGKSSEPNGIRMYFDDLRCAFNTLFEQNHDQFIPQDEYLPPVDGKGREAYIMSRDGEKELVVRARLHSMIKDDSLPSTPAIYYHFPKGPAAFQKQVRVKLNQFRDYNPALPFFPVHYLVNENGIRKKESLAFRFLKKQAKIESQNLLSVLVTNKHFGNSFTGNRKVSELEYQEQFYYKDIQEAMKHILSLDMNRLNEYVAWENNLSGFYNNVSLLQEEYRIGELFSITNVNSGKPGIFYTNRASRHYEAINTALSVLPKSKDFSSTFQVGAYNDLFTNARPLKELEQTIYLQKAVPERIQPRKSNAVPVKQKGRSPRM
ncbi:hypothetical protein [Chitinophaga barathri]|uniref:Uncharacterized protein n=1 Tax=Chitinophaga barathri TaxID=1647451 RepID=A0A3N4MS49_9BACT|nr:hypothetical protein [Chitinophaga barathri]RPD42960.1 hypothetical protein EG028_01320 [Chitinophaga barathri]